MRRLPLRCNEAAGRRRASAERQSTQSCATNEAQGTHVLPRVTFPVASPALCGVRGFIGGGLHTILVAQTLLVGGRVRCEE